MTQRMMILFGVGVWLWAMSPAQATEPEEPLLCVPLKQIECSTTAGCLEQTVGAMRIPQFIRVDVGAQQISGMADGDMLSTAIQNVQHIDGKTILQGAERGRAWSIIINNTTYEMTASVADEQVSFSIFGSCLPLSASVLGGNGK